MKKKKQCIARGQFGWDGCERRNDRYGNFYLDGDGHFLSDDCEGFEGTRMKLSAVVLQVRKSRHIGDLFLGVYPSQPRVGEVIEIGTGTFRLDLLEQPPNTTRSIGLEPADGREEFWIDPKILYRLHDQTVEIFAEEATPK